jgi:hypothetical protein
MCILHLNLTDSPCCYDLSGTPFLSFIFSLVSLHALRHVRSALDSDFGFGHSLDLYWWYVRRT